MFLPYFHVRHKEGPNSPPMNLPQSCSVAVFPDWAASFLVIRIPDTQRPAGCSVPATPSLMPPHCCSGGMLHKRKWELREPRVFNERVRSLLRCLFSPPNFLALTVCFLGELQTQSVKFYLKTLGGIWLRVVLN